MRFYPDCTETLTRAERAAPFALAPDAEPLPPRRRLLVEWEGERWAETDPATGVTLAIGNVLVLGHGPLPETREPRGLPATEPGSPAGQSRGATKESS